MNREIKFRVYVKDDEYSPDGMHFVDLKDEVSEYDCRVMAEHELMQFTGLLDKNGVEIYEGDIVQYPNPICKGNVKFGDYEGGEYDSYECGTGFYIDGVHMHLMALLKKDASLNLTVIGNIHENPELLNETK